MVRITRKAFPDCGEYTVWKKQTWGHSFFTRFGTMKCRRAKLLFLFPVWRGIWFGCFWTYGTGWIQ